MAWRNQKAISIGGKYLFEAISCENGWRSVKALAKAAWLHGAATSISLKSSIGGAGESLAKAKNHEGGGGVAKAAKAQRNHLAESGTERRNGGENQSMSAV
jgi:hypothetical protein